MSFLFVFYYWLELVFFVLFMRVLKQKSPQKLQAFYLLIEWCVIW